VPVSAPKTDLEEYCEWAIKEMGWDLGPSTRTYYQTVTAAMRDQVVASQLWLAFCERYKQIEDRYYGERKGHHLFQNPSPPEWQTKSFESIVAKSFRVNKLANGSFPSEPPGGWVTPDSWLEQVGDIVRTRVVVKYLDGPEYLAQALREIATETGQSVRVEYKCREDGYYAAHVDLRYTLEIPERDWDTRKIGCSCELQITTQLQELVQSLMHRYYEDHRLAGPAGHDDMPWQWRYRNAEFSASYLGHVLHYLEGMIMGVRDKIGDEQ
jgi:ppGpp synthetase/RelA/SpoT-type nucleotidyltranferase